MNVILFFSILVYSKETVELGWWVSVKHRIGYDQHSHWGYVNHRRCFLVVVSLPVQLRFMLSMSSVYLLNTVNSFSNHWMLSFSSILNEIVKGSIESLHYCKTDVKSV